MIKPTIGRKVYFRDSVKGSMLNSLDPAQPFDATVVFVHNDALVNLRVTDHMGISTIRNSVPLVQEGEPKPEEGGFCHWMPFQVGQAKAQAAAS